MSSRPLMKPYAVITNGAMSASLTSKVTIIDNMSLISYSISWSGTSPVGVMDVQVSNDYAEDASGNVSNAGTWSSLPLSASPTVSGATGNGFIDIDANAGYALRIVYTRTSGTGTMNAIVKGKSA